MKIRKITFENHFLFGNLHLDFTNIDSKSVDTIIIAGENGVGKSLLLNELFGLFNIYDSKSKRQESKMFEIELSDEELNVLMRYVENRAEVIQERFKNNIVIIFVQYYQSDWTNVKIKGYDKSGNLVDLENSDDFLFFDTKNISQVLKTIFSDVEINFTPKPIKSISSTNIDNQISKSQKSSENSATEITQLLIDIQSIDALELNEWVRENPGLAVDANKIDSRMRRFIKAFNYMFTNKKYKKIDTFDDKKHVIFEEHGIEMGISQLSSGEKQVVFRGSFLIKDKESLKGVLVLIDEPEISMHPIWQLKILNFFKKLFTDDEGNQTSQLIVTTHSPFIIHNSSRENDKVIILKKDNVGNITVSDKPEFYGWTKEKIIHEAFNVNYNLNSNKMIVLVEGETDEKYFNKALEVFEKENIGLEFRWIGRLNEKGNAEYTGVKALDNAKNHYISNPELLNSKVVLFYDSDTNKNEEDFGNLIIRRMIQNDVNNVYKKGVENLLNLPASFEYSNFYTVRYIDNGYGKTTIEDLEKMKLCDHICGELKIDEQKEILKNISEEIERISKI